MGAGAVGAMGVVAATGVILQAQVYDLNREAILEAYAAGLTKRNQEDADPNNDAVITVNDLTNAQITMAQDVFRHGYSSGFLKVAYGEDVATAFDSWEWVGPAIMPILKMESQGSTQDLFNNSAIRQADVTTENLLDTVMDALRNNDLALDQTDPRLDNFIPAPPPTLEELEQLAEDFLNAAGEFLENFQNFFDEIFNEASDLFNWLKGLDFWESLFNQNDSNSDGRSDAQPEMFGPFLPEDPNMPQRRASPLVLDLDGDGIEVYAKGAYGTFFDLRGNGQAVLTGWVAPDDGLLALDINENGIIDGASELFGSLTTDGFSVLATHDSNGNGAINASDTVFANLLVWTDLNSDGISQENELHTLGDLDITSISLNATRAPNVDMNGNTLTHESSFTMDGITHDIADIWFDYDAGTTRNAADFTLDVRTLFLPTLRGHGDLKDLHIAASIDNGATPDTLIEQLGALAGALGFDTVFTDWDALEDTMDDLLFAWAGIEGVSPTGRGAYVNGQYMAFFEKYTGEAFLQYGRSNPLPEAGQEVNAIYEHIRTVYAIQIITQAVGTEIFEHASYDLYTGGIAANDNRDKKFLGAGTARLKQAA